MKDLIQQAAEDYYPLDDSPSLIVTVNEDTIVEIEREAFINGANWGAAKERERMKGVFEKASEDGWYYAHGWRDRNEELETRINNAKTTDELIKQYENKEV